MSVLCSMCIYHADLTAQHVGTYLLEWEERSECFWCIWGHESIKHAQDCPLLLLTVPPTHYLLGQFYETFISRLVRGICIVTLNAAVSQGLCVAAVFLNKHYAAAVNTNKHTSKLL